MPIETITEGTGKAETIDKIIDTLGADDDKIKDDDLNLDEDLDKKEDEEKDNKDDKDQEDKEDEEEEELDLEDKDKDAEKYLDVPARKVILKAYPDIFKKFPGIEHAMYREKQFTEIFVDPKEAEEAKSSLDELNQFKDKVYGGNLADILKTVKENNPDGFNKIRGNYLIELQKVDEGAYYSTINHVITTSIYTMFMNGKEMGGEQGEQYQIAAQLLNQFINGPRAEIRVPHRAEAPKEDEAKKKLEEEKRQFAETKLNDAIEDVQTRTSNIVKAIIERNIDTKEQMTQYVRTKAIQDVSDDVDDAIENDTRFKIHLDKLWKKAAEKNFNRASTEEIKTALLAKAKSVLPDIIRRRKADALKGIGKVIREEKKEETTRKTATEDRQQSRSSKVGEEGVKNRKLSTYDILNQD